MPLSHYLTNEDIRRKLGMVIPVWFADDVPADQVRALLGATLADAEAVARPGRIVLVVDGLLSCADEVSALRGQLGSSWGAPPATLRLHENVGKGGAVAAGMEALLGDAEVEFVCVRDADGDHFVSDVPRQVRLATQMVTETGNANVLVVGARESVHAPLGFARGEYELLLNDVLWSAFAYHSAQTQTALNEQYLVGMHPPDLQSGYKVYSREAAALTVRAFEQVKAERPDLDLSRWGSEIVPVTAVVTGGGVLGQQLRATFNVQPVTAFGDMDRARIYARKLRWVFGEVGLTEGVALQFLDNALPRRTLFYDDDGRAELLRFRRLAMQELCEERTLPTPNVPAFL